MTAILECTLNYGPATVLTNGTVFKESWLERLRRAEDASPYSLEFRVSIDGFTPQTNDPIRGSGTYERAMHGVRQLLTHGFLPIITVTQSEEDANADRLFDGFVLALKSVGYQRPRIKILPTLRIGAEEERRRGYRPEERVTPEMMAGFDESTLLCNHSRIVTDRGVYVCPILVAAPDACLGSTLGEAQGSYRLRHHACYTCYRYGTLCANPTGVARDA